MKRFFVHHLSLIVSVILMLTSCEQINLDQAKDEGSTHHITLHISGYTMIPFSSAAKASSSLPAEGSSRASASTVSHIDIAVFAEDGTKVTKINQKAGNSDFGSPSLTLSDGIYTLVVIAHNGLGVATISSPEEVTFANNKVTDTFYTSQKLVVSEATASKEVELVRSVSMVRVILTDTSFPDNFSQLQLYYTGGSSTFNPATGFGSKNSRQTEIRQYADAAKDADGHPVFDIYTFPHAADGALKITLTPLDSQAAEIASAKTLENVPVSINFITEARGTLFANGTSPNTSAASLSFTLNDTWSGTKPFNF